MAPTASNSTAFDEVGAVGSDACSMFTMRTGAVTLVSGSVPSTGAEVAPSDPSATVDGKNVAQSVFDQLVSNGKQVNQVSCPDLAAKMGASQRCTLMSGTETYGVTVTVTSVQGTDVKFDIQVDQTPQ